MKTRITLGVIVALVVGMSFMRFVSADFRLTASRPPDPLTVIVALIIVGAILAGMARLLRGRDPQPVLTTSILLIAGLFIVFKTEPLAAGASRLWRGLTGQDTTLASMSRPELARLFLRRLSLDSHSARPADGHSARTVSARVRHLRDLFPRLYRRAD